MKFRVKVFEDKWNGKRVTTGKQIRQKTFEAESWEEAEVIAHKIWTEVEEQNANAGHMNLEKLNYKIKLRA